MAAENARPTISSLEIFLIMLSVVGFVFFAWQIAESVTEINTKLVGEDMMDAAEDMSKLKSYSGSSVAEYFYRYQGEYLKGEAKIHNAEVRIQQRASIGIDLIGILVCVGLFVVGTRTKTTKAIMSQKELHPRSQTNSSSKASGVVAPKSQQTSTIVSHAEDQFDEDL